MDVGRMSMAFSQNSVKSAVSISLMKMTMNNKEQVANNMNQMLAQTAVDPNLGNKIDVKA